MNRKPANSPLILRYVYAILAVIALTVTAVVVALSVVQRNELAARNQIQFVHFASVAEAQELARETRTLNQMVQDRLNSRQSDRSGPAGIRSVQLGYTGILQSMRSRILQLSEVQRTHSDVVVAATLQRLVGRFDRIDRELRGSEMSPEIIDSLEALGTNVEQFNRLHQIAAEYELHELAERQSWRPQFYAILIACLAFSSLAGTYLILSLKSSMRLQRETEVALADSQERLHHIQKLDALGRLVGGVAHDFNNWLTVILGHVELLQETAKDNARVERGLGEIRQAGLQAAALTQQLLAFSRRQQLNPRIVNLNKQIKSMEPMLSRIIGEDVRLRFRYAADPYTVEVDPDQLQQVVMNLISNARDAMPAGGDLTVRTANIVIGAEGAAVEGVPDGEYARLTVSDSGTGMSEEVRQRIFEPFFTTKDEGHGTGLGLSTAHGIVTGSRGYIVVDSAEGSGSRFHLYFPRVDGRVGTAADESANVAPQHGTETVLVVEDDEQVRKFVATGLSSLGYRVLTASGGAGGLDICRSEPDAIDVILSDVIMPEVSGPQFMDRALRLRPDAAPIYMSAYTRDEVLRFRRSGAIDIPLISKPFTLDALSNLIRERLDGRV